MKTSRLLPGRNLRSIGLSPLLSRRSCFADREAFYGSIRCVLACLVINLLLISHHVLAALQAIASEDVPCVLLSVRDVQQWQCSFPESKTAKGHTATTACVTNSTFFTSPWPFFSLQEKKPYQKTLVSSFAAVSIAYIGTPHTAGAGCSHVPCRCAACSES